MKKFMGRALLERVEAFDCVSMHLRMYQLSLMAPFAPVRLGAKAPVEPAPGNTELQQRPG